MKLIIITYSRSINNNNNNNIKAVRTRTTLENFTMFIHFFSLVFFHNKHI